jgi:ribosomal protein S18 acetylase RimI-like enzyme
MREKITWRFEPKQSDVARVKEIIEATGFFKPAEADCAAELVAIALANAESGYHFIFAEDASGKLLGYACYGRDEMTRRGWDLYWIAVDPVTQGMGVGKILIKQTERLIHEKGGPGSRIIVETSGRPQYEPTRQFYLRCDYVEIGHFPDYYDDGDGKVTYLKVV